MVLALVLVISSSLRGAINAWSFICSKSKELILK